MARCSPGVRAIAEAAVLVQAAYNFKTKANLLTICKINLWSIGKAAVVSMLRSPQVSPIDTIIQACCSCRVAGVSFATSWGTIRCLARFLWR